VKTAQRRRFSLSYPVGLDVDINKNGLTESLQSVLDLYKTPENIALERFIRELTEAAGGKDVPAASRRFLNWDLVRSTNARLKAETASLILQVQAGQAAPETY
jgi:hypothetical protein